MTATDALGSVLREAARDGVAEALAVLVERLDRIDDPRPAVWTVPQAAVVLGAGEDVVRRWVHEGLLGRLPGTNTILIPRRAVDVFLDAAVQTRQDAT